MSATTESLTQKWLRQNIQVYSNKETVYAHVDAALARFQSIRPKTDIYTYDDGRTQLLLCLHGLLPISYRGTPYNIPIALWITREYPRIPPIPYVVPTSDMLVRASKYVDVSGRCGIEYLRNWERKSEGCNISALLEAMQDHFSRVPPVYAKPKHPLTSQPEPQPPRPDTTAPHYSERPPPPLPGAHPTPPPLAQSVSITTTRNDDRPPLPVKPTATMSNFGSSAATSAQSRSQSPTVVGASTSLSARSPPPLPPHPPTELGLPQYRTSPVSPRYVPTYRSASSSIEQGPNSPSLSSWSPDPSVVQRPSQASQVATPVLLAQATLPLQTTHPHPTPPPPAISSSRSGRGFPQPLPPPLPPAFISPRVISSSYPVHQEWSPPVPPSGAQVSPHPPPHVPQPPSIPPPDLLDDDDLSPLSVTPAQTITPAPAPPRPPNPELLRLHSQVHAKLTSELASLSQAMALDAERLRAHQTDLLAGEPAIRDEMARLEAVRDVCRNVAGRLKTVVEEGERNVAELKRKGDPEVDELICSTTIVHNQLINLVAEDNAIEDTIYHLHRALNAGRIDLERFLRTTRVLAEEQFTKRALIEKILAGIPMGGSMMMSMSPDWR